MLFITKSQEETIELGKKLGLSLKGGELILLEGDLGGGKTQFTKGIAIGLGIDETIVSPTFTIERLYKSPKKLTLHHFDFYRLSFEDEELKEELGEILQDKSNVIVIEWPENLKLKLPAEYLKVQFEYEDEKVRKLNLISCGEKYNKLVGSL